MSDSEDTATTAAPEAETAPAPAGTTTEQPSAAESAPAEADTQEPKKEEEPLSIGGTPISDDAPTGIDARYEPEYEKLKSEIEKLQSVTDSSVSWRDVVELGELIIKEKSKDILVASYLCYGLFEQRGYRGFAEGLGILRDMVAVFWENMFPALKRARARASALEWMAEKIGQIMPDKKPSASDKPAVEQALERLEQLESMLDEKLADKAPSFMDIRRPLRQYHDEFKREERQKEAAAKQQGQASASAGASGGAQAAAPENIASDSDAQKALKSCQDVLRKVVSYQREKKLADPSPYYLLRVATWMSIAQLPPDQDGATQIRELAPERLAFFEEQMKAGNHEALIPELENSFARAPFWLDVHRMTATALEALGHEDAVRAVTSALADFLTRFPSVLELKFLGGNPFADSMTQSWIKDQVLKGSGGGGEGGNEKPADPPWQIASREAAKFASKGKVKNGIAIFREGRAAAGSDRERFHWDLAQARFCRDAGLVDIAIPQLEYLDNRSEELGLDDWEPEASVELATLLLECYKKSPPKGTPAQTQERAERMERLRARVCRLDVGAAMALK